LKSITRLKEKKNFEIEDIIEELKKDERTDREIKNAGIGLFEAARLGEFFK